MDSPLNKPPRLLDQVRTRMRTLHLSARTESAYVDWIRRYIIFHNKTHPREMGAREVEQFLSYLAVERKVAASTQNQALAALLFLYREVLAVDLPWLDGLTRAQSSKRLPVVLTQREVRELLLHLNVTGMRLLEGLRLRVKDIEFERREIIVRSGKGDKDRVTMLPEDLILPLQRQLDHAKAIHDGDLAAGFGDVWLPNALTVTSRVGAPMGLAVRVSFTLAFARSGVGQAATPSYSGGKHSARGSYCGVPRWNQQTLQPACVAAFICHEGADRNDPHKTNRCCSRVMTSARSWNCWVTRMLRRR